MTTSNLMMILRYFEQKWLTLALYDKTHLFPHLKKPEITVKVKARQPLNENNRLDAFSDMTAPENIGNEDYLAFQGDCTKQII
jgi:hypothetical protein